MPATTTIVVFDMPSEAEAEFLARWRESNAFMRAQPGQLGGTLYRSTKREGNARFVNVARWESEAAMQSARQAADEMRRTSGFDQARTFERLNVSVETTSYVDETHYGPSTP